MTDEKKTTVLRIVIFLIITFVPAYIFQIFFSDDTATLKSYTGTITIMLYPAIASIITQLITKEKDRNNFLHINLKGNERYYIFSLIVPVVFGIVGGFIFVLLFVKDYNFSSAIELNGGWLTVTATILFSLMLCFPQFFMGFGEEFGWRGYLTPELEKLVSEPTAVIITGIVWGLWHAPLVAKGYDWGTDYPLFPYLGIVLMCLSCIIMSFILTWLTKKTDSVYPASIFHIILDVMMSTVSTVIIGDTAETEKHSFVSALIFMIILPLLTLILCCLENRKVSEAVSERKL